MEIKENEITNPIQIGLSIASLVENLVFALNIRAMASSFP